MAVPVADGYCRYCGDPSWSSDEQGPIHRCCSRVEATGEPCISCRESRVAAAAYARRRSEAAHRLRQG